MNTQEQSHPTEDELVLLFYGDTGPDEERRLAGHIETCLECQPVWREIKSSLAAVDAAGIPEPPPDFERVMWAKVQREIGDFQPAARWWAPKYWLATGSLAVVMLAVSLGPLVWNRQQASEIDAANATNGSANVAKSSQPERALLVAMDEHLERSELLLVELMNADEPGFETSAADDLLLSSRLYRQTAAHTGHVELASMLEDLERVLVEIARGPKEMKKDDLDALRTRITDEDLLFKVRVVTDEVRKRQQAIATVSEGDL
jgi:hypothetical protein